MKAMILAAGLGTRLRPLTSGRPKALVMVGGRTLLEIALTRLGSFGVTEAIVNTHHYAEMIADYLAANRNFGMRVEVSREESLLDTGGGLKNAAWFFLERGAASDEPFFLHNVDVISTIDLADMLRAHREGHALATLAVQQRETSRYLLFDRACWLCGRQNGKDGEAELVRRCADYQALAFAGIHVISPRIFSLLPEESAFSIITAYVNLAARGNKIAGRPANDAYWRDVGRPQAIAQAERELASGESAVG